MSSLLMPLMLMLLLQLLRMLLLLLLLFVAVSVCGAFVAQAAQTQREMGAGERANGDELVLKQRQKDAEGAWRCGKRRGGEWAGCRVDE